MLWDLNDGKHLYSLPAQDEIHALVFSPNRYWLCAATSSSIKIWDLESKKLVEDIELPTMALIEGEAWCPRGHHAISLAWSADGQYLFVGYTDSNIRVWRVTRS